jgi:hypothetical protein
MLYNKDYYFLQSNNMKECKAFFDKYKEKVYDRKS